MFTDPGTIWLTVTNLMLGLATLACLVLLGMALFGEWRVRRSQRGGPSDGDHVYPVEGLGVTMADGGEKILPGKAG